MSKQLAMAQATERAVAALADVDWPDRLLRLGLPAPTGDGTVSFRLFNEEVQLSLTDLQLRVSAGGVPVRAADRILVLHYLQHSGCVAAANRLVAFSEFPAGSFYLGPFRSRTVDPLLARFGNDLETLRARLTRLAAVAVPLGDVGARIRAFGPLCVTLVYRRGDDEFAPTADLLFDACFLGVFGTEDATVLASRICLGLL